MTVPAALTTYRYLGNGVTTVFAYSNRLLSTSDVKVQILTRATDAIVETLTLTTDYTVTLVSNDLANITITNAAKIPSVTQDILLSLDLAISQTRSYPRADSLPAADIERGLDKLTLVAQLLDDGQSRTLRFPASDTATNGELPPKAERALTYLAFDSNGVPIASPSAAGGAPAGAFGATLVATATKTDAQTLLSVPSYTAPTTTVGASIALAEGTTNGTSIATIKAADSLASNITLVATADGNIVTEAGTQTLTNKTAATAATADNSTKLATTAYVDNTSGLPKINTASFSKTSNTTPTDITGLTWALGAGTYIVEFYCDSTCASAGGIVLRGSFSGTATGKYFSMIGFDGSTGINFGTTTTPFTSIGTTGVTAPRIAGRQVFVVTVAGTYTIQMAQAVSNATATTIPDGQFTACVRKV